ncbi:MAG: tRNA uridine-5-carboxymethylaminomethyl(34) synthesis GTPase MnmE [Aestuariivirga sp.]|nr:tRNA uridine-5-carboxymethylaminomethyl(34) synthesis GTPase MnmE [Aestuariivirga sp.]
MNNSDTIFAVSSGSGMAGIAVIRMSGVKAGSVLASVAGSLPLPRRASVRQLRRPQSREIIDQGLILWMPGPLSATGEDVAEFHVHGSAAVIDAMFEVLRAVAGVRLAEPGEFTRRAFVNDRVDLVEAEGLADLLQARTEAQRRMAMHHMLGHASSQYEAWRTELISLLARAEAAIDFVEEDGVAAAALTDVRPKTLDLVARLSRAAADADRAGALRSGIKVVFAGAPNVGKSTLLNLVAAREAAIVSSRPGTTRDVIEVPIVLGGIPVILTDTAGLRAEAGDEVEVIGMERARSEVSAADIVVWVTSADVAEDIENAVVPALKVLNKSDLPGDAQGMDLKVSAKTGEGIADLILNLEKLVKVRFGGMEQASVIRTRHKDAVEESIRFLNDSLLHDAGHIELAAECLRRACFSLGRVTGRVDVEDLLGNIFSEFCIGK